MGLRSRRCQRLLEGPDTPHAVGAKVVKEYGGDMSHFGAPMYTHTPPCEIHRMVVVRILTLGGQPWLISVSEFVNL